MPTPVAVGIELTDDERARLESWARRRSSAQALALRSRIVLLAAEGLKNTEIARRLGIDHATARKWRTRFAERRLEGVLDEPRPGRPRTITDEQVEEVIVRTLETTPKDATHWSTRSMAREVGLTQSAVLRIWRAFGLQPHRVDPAAAARHPRARDTRLQALGHLQPLCGAEHHQRRGDRPPALTPPRDRVEEVPGHTRPRGSRRARNTPRARQLLDAQDAGDPALAGRAPALRLALHPDLELVAEPRRALVRRAHHQEAAARRAPLRARAQRRHPRLDRGLERQPTTVRLDQDGRRNPRLHRPLLRTNQRITTLGREHELVGELARQAGGGDLAGHGGGVVLDPLDAHADPAALRLQHGERAARVAVLRLAHRPAVDEQHAAVLVDPGLVGVAEDQRVDLLGGGEALVQARRLVLEEVLVDLARRAVHEVHRGLADLEAQVERQVAHVVLAGLVGVLERPVDRALAELAVVGRDVRAPA